MAKLMQLKNVEFKGGVAYIYGSCHGLKQAAQKCLNTPGHDSQNVMEANTFAIMDKNGTGKERA